mgnify:CR=1 FL=1
MSDIPDFMREFDTSTDYGFTPVSSKPADDSKPSVGKEDLNTSNLEISKSDVLSIKSMMNEIMQIVSEKESVNKEIQDADVQKRFKEIEKVVLPFLYNLSKSNEPYIHWPNRETIIKAQMATLL